MYVGLKTVARQTVLRVDLEASLRYAVNESVVA
jgi:hypothetical protein